MVVVDLLARVEVEVECQRLWWTSEQDRDLRWKASEVSCLWCVISTCIRSAQLETRVDIRRPRAFAGFVCVEANRLCMRMLSPFREKGMGGCESRTGAGCEVLPVRSSCSSCFFSSSLHPRLVDGALTKECRWLVVQEEDDPGVWVEKGNGVFGGGW